MAPVISGLEMYDLSRKTILTTEDEIYKMELETASYDVLSAPDTEISFETYSEPHALQEGETDTTIEGTTDNGEYTVDIDRTEGDISKDNINITINGDTLEDTIVGEYRGTYPLRYAIDRVLSSTHTEIQDLRGLSPTARVSRVRLQAIILACMAIEDMAKNTLRGNVGEESFTNFIGGVLTHIPDLGLLLLNVFKTYLTRGLADFKRSELHAFMDNNVMSVKRVYWQDYKVFSGVALPMPHEVKCRELETPLKTVVDFLSQLQMISKLDALLSVIKKIKANTSVAGSVVGETNDDGLLNMGKQITELYQRNNIDKLSFPEVYPSVSAFRETMEHVRAAEHFFFDVSSVHARLKDIDKTMSGVELGAIDATAAGALATRIRQVAQMLTDFGNSITILSIVDHHAAIHLDLCIRETRS